MSKLFGTVLVLNFSILQLLIIMLDQTLVTVGKNMIASIAFSQTAILNLEKAAVLLFQNRKQESRLLNFLIELQFAKIWDKCAKKKSFTMAQ